MSIIKEKYGEFQGEEVYAFTLSNNNLQAEIISFGGIITRLIYKDVDVVLGRNSLKEYENNKGYLGALIGRNSNRIESAEFHLNCKNYKLFANNGRSNLHGGKVGFDKKVWDAEMLDGEEPSLTLRLTSPDGEEGFPGEVKVKVTYTLTKDNAIRIHYQGESDQDTVFNMTNHSYFNLNGHCSGTVDGHTLWVDSEFYTPNTDECIPTGEISSVKGTPFDFSTDANLGERFASDFGQIRMFGGFDHNLAISGSGYRLAAKLRGDKTGIVMEMYTDQKGVQIYTANALTEGTIGKDSAIYGRHHAVCLETQAFPNNLKYSHFPSAVLKKGEKYDTITTYKFQ